VFWYTNNMKLKAYFSTKNILVTIVLLLILVVAWFFLHNKNNTQDQITTTVERGSVQDIVSVSGFVEAKNTAGLSFPVVGIVTDVFINEGAEVKRGDLLATLGSAQLVAQRSDAVAVLQKAQASRDELVSGPTPEARAVTDTTVASTETTLANIIATEAEKVASARAALLNNSLEIRAVDKSESTIPPTLSGSYTCSEEGIYSVSVYRSSGYAGFSYKLTGLENATDVVSTRQPALMGTCGLLAQFTDGEAYANSEWIIEVPNTKSSTYVTYSNAYELALQQQEQSVQTATDAFSLATDNATFVNAAPNNAALRQMNASVASAQARVAQIEAQIADLSIIAPFDGIITDVEVRPGETAGATPVITILAQDAFELKARIPEIDITKISTGQQASVVFDAQSRDTLTGTLTFVSPLATLIDGVAYFDTTIVLDQIPQWIRSGLNADIDIIVADVSDVLRIPKRYLITNADNTYSVLTAQGITPVSVTSTGNSGYVAITGLNAGDTVITP
jgi:HlyD family secretion protein